MPIDQLERVTATDRLLAQAVKAARIATERSLDAKLALAVKAARQVIAAELNPEIKSLREEQVRVREEFSLLPQEFARQVKADQASTDALLDAHMARVESHLAEQLAEFRQEVEANLKQQRETYEAQLAQIIELVKALPSPQVVNQLPEIKPEVRVEVASPSVTVETPPMEKTFEYDAAGRPSKVIERRSKGK